MAKIRNTDVASKDVFADFRKSAETSVAVLKEMEKVLKDNLTQQKEFSKGFKATNVQDIKKLATAQNEVKKSVAGLNEVEKEKIRLEATLSKLRKVKNQDNEQLKIVINEQRKANRELAKDQTNLGNAYQRLTRDTNKAQAEFKRLAAQFGVNSKEAKNARNAFEKLDTKLRTVNEAARDGRRDVGRYGTAFSKLGGALKSGLGFLGITAGIAGISRLIGGAVNIFKDFEQANSKLQSVLGATSDEMDKLKVQAKELGSVTSFTASQVTELQTEFAKLGFPTKEILNMTESTLNAAAAMGSGLGEQAALTGATIKAFGLSSKDAVRVNDVLAKSTSRSALDFSKLNASMSTIAPVASKLGFGLEDTVALLGNLSDSGFDASTAATATRNIMLKLADSSSVLGKRLKEPVKDLPSLIKGLRQLTDEGVDLSEALELTDVRSVAAFSTFLSGTDSLEKLSAELKNANGAAKDMADTMLNNLAGDITKAGSAWEGFILSLEDGEGVISNVLRNATQFFTEFFTRMTRAAKSFQQNLKFDLSIEDKKLEKTIRAQIDDNIKERRREADEEIKMAESRLKRGVDSEEQFIKEKTRINKEFQDFEKKAFEETVKREIQENENINKSIIQNTKFKDLTIDNAERILEANQEASITMLTGLESQDRKEKRSDALFITRTKSKIAALERILEAGRDVNEVIVDETIVIDENTGSTNENNKSKEKKVSLLRELITKTRALTKEEKDAADEERKRREAEAEANSFANRIKKAVGGLTKIEDIGEDQTLLRAEYRAKREAEIREKGLDVLKALNDKYFKDQNDKADKQLTDAEKREKRLQELADKGVQDASDSLAKNQKDQAEAVKKKEELRQQEKKTELALAVLKAYSAELEKPGADPSTAFAKAIASSALLVSAISALPAFFDGTENTGNNGKGVDGKGGFLSVLHPNERVVPKVINDKLDGISNKELGDLADNGMLNYALNSQQMGVKYSSDSKITKELNKLQDLNKGIIKAIESRPIDEGWKVDDIKKVVSHTVRTSSKRQKTTFKL